MVDLAPRLTAASGALPDAAGLNFYDADPNLAATLRLRLAPEYADRAAAILREAGEVAGGELDRLARQAERNPAALAAQREREKAQVRARWPTLPEDVRDSMLDKMHGADVRDYELTAPVANQSGARWSDDEDRYVLDHPRTPAREVALTLGRSLWAVRNRRVKLRRGTAAG